MQQTRAMIHETVAMKQNSQQKTSPLFSFFRHVDFHRVALRRPGRRRRSRASQHWVPSLSLRVLLLRFSLHAPLQEAD